MVDRRGGRRDKGEGRRRGSEEERFARSSPDDEVERGELGIWNCEGKSL